MKEGMEPSPWALAGRILAALALFAGGAALFRFRPDTGSDAEKLAWAFGGFVCIVAGAGFLLAPALRLFGGAVDALFFPQDSYTPPPLPKLAYWYLAQGRHDEAALEFEKICHNYPRDPMGYLGLLDVAIYYRQNAAEGAEILKRGLKKIRGDQHRNELQARYEWLMSGQPPPPLPTSAVDEA
jgi:hypothetical protein